MNQFMPPAEPLHDWDQMDAPRHRPPRNWWSRNWKWVVPVSVITPVLVCGGFFGLLVGAVFGMIKSCGAYQDAVAAAKADTAVVAALGLPIEEGFFVMGNIEINGSTGYADLAIPIEGPRGSGTIYVEAEKQGGDWAFYTLEVVVEDTWETYDLLGGY